MRSASLPGRAGQVRGDRLDEASVGVGRDETNPGQAAGDEVGEETVPRGPGLAGRDAQSQDLAAPVGVDTGCDHDDGVDDPAAFADLHREGVGGDERERASVAQGTVAELVDVLVELSGHAGHLRLGQRVDPQRLHELVHPAGTHPGEVAVRDDGDHRRLSPFAALEEPFREVRARSQLRDLNIDGTDAGVEVAVPVAVALGSPVGAGLAPFRADDSIRVGGKQSVDDGLQHAAHQIRRRVREGFDK